MELMAEMRENYACHKEIEDRFLLVGPFFKEIEGTKTE